MKRFSFFLILAFLALVAIVSCQKWKDSKPFTDPRLTNPYCNDPNAVNYNWGFPGRPDDSICFYPTDVYVGKYLFIDSVLHSDNSFFYSDSIMLNFYALSQTKMAILGFCSSGDSVKLTVDRSMNAVIDTTIAGFGQAFCGSIDTVSGTIQRVITDTTNKTFTLNFTVVSDTTVNFHTGTLRKQ